MTDADKAQGVFRALKQLRNRGWMVAAHNDYRLAGKSYTFWLFTSMNGPWFAKGESTEDIYALNQVLEKVDAIETAQRHLESTHASR